MDKLVASPVFDPLMGLEEMLAICSRLGFRKYEIMTSWVQAAFHPEQGAAYYLDLANQYGMQYTSLHLPPVEESDPTGTLQRATDYTHFAKQLGVDVVIFKAATRDLYIQHASAYLDSVEDLGITTVITNHASSPIATLEEYSMVLDGAADNRLKALLEVGHFYKVGVSWEKAYELLRDRVALVHIKEMQGENPVAPYGEGEVAFAELFKQLSDDGYTGNYVVELEKVPQSQAVNLLEQSVVYLQKIFPSIDETSNNS